MSAPSDRPPGGPDRPVSIISRILRMPAWRVGLGMLGVASAMVYLTALEFNALMSQVLAAFATGGSVMISLGRFDG